jgi:hypothetical protein
MANRVVMAWLVGTVVPMDSRADEISIDYYSFVVLISCVRITMDDSMVEEWQSLSYPPHWTMMPTTKTTFCHRHSIDLWQLRELKTPREILSDLM